MGCYVSIFPALPGREMRRTLGSCGKQAKPWLRRSLSVMTACPPIDPPARLPARSIGQQTRVEIAAGYPLWQEGRLALNRTAIWPEPIAAGVWEYRLGGYRVLARWLAQRRHSTLEPTDLDHLARMIDALRTTLRITDIIDQRA